MDDLAKWINSQYLEVDVIAQIRSVVESEGAVALQEFFIRDDILRCDGERMFVPDQIKCETYALMPECDAFVMSKEFGAYLDLLIGKKDVVLRRGLGFSSGDYSLLGEHNLFEGISFVLCLRGGWNPTWGGAATYKQQNGDVMQFPPEKNTVIIAQCSEALQEYFSYVNHHADGEIRYLQLHVE